MTEAVLLTFPTQKYAMPITPPRRLRRDERSGALLTDEHAARLTRSGRLQARDMAVLETVWMLGAMTSGQIRRAVFHTLKNETNARTVANRRLRFLYDEYCLDRMVMSLHSEPIYMLDVQGARLIQMSQGASTRRDINWSPKESGKQLFFLEHQLGITEFVVSLMEACRPNKIDLKWVGESALSLEKPDKSRFEPDGLGFLAAPNGKKLLFFLEWDRGTESSRDLTQKWKHYFDYVQQPKQWNNDLAAFIPQMPRLTKFPPVLFITTAGPRRLKNMFDLLHRLNTHYQPEQQLFPLWLTNWEHLAKKGLFAEVFFAPGLTSPEEFGWDKGFSFVRSLR